MKFINLPQRKLLSILLLLVLSPFFANKALTFESNKLYDCYIMNGNSLRSWTVTTSGIGKILNEDKLEPDVINMFKSGKCEIQKAKHYTCKHSSGLCHITLYENGETHGSCDSITAETLVNEVKAGKCQLVKED